jgi:hypothetical protein
MTFGQKTFGRHMALVNKMFGLRNVFSTLLVDEQLIYWTTISFYSLCAFRRLLYDSPVNEGSDMVFMIH